jgi:hypothetical protein
MIDYQYKINAIEILSITENREKTALFKANDPCERHEEKPRSCHQTSG